MQFFSFQPFLCKIMFLNASISFFLRLKNGKKLKNLPVLDIYRIYRSNIRIGKSRANQRFNYI
ncbi:MAG TPA: hypothetical protein DCG69_05315 [Bacteroidales bacterium]|nr:hypothetical protein [Bacteroidales bacterium]